MRAVEVEILKTQKRKEDEHRIQTLRQQLAEKQDALRRMKDDVAILREVDPGTVSRREQECQQANDSQSKQAPAEQKKHTGKDKKRKRSSRSISY